MNKKNNLGIILVVIAVILLGGLLVYLIKSDKLNLGNDNNLNFDETVEIKELDNKIKDIKSSLGFITILTSIDKYNAGGDYVTKKNKNLLEDTKTKQLFVMEQIIVNKDNYQNFIVLNTSGELDEDAIDPTTEATTAYYPYDLFIKEYNKYFKDDFVVEERQVSFLDSTYDKDKNYIYYENRKSGLNLLFVENIEINSVNKISSREYQANLTLNYSKRLSDMLGVESETVQLTYFKDNGMIKIDSYMLK